MRLPIVVAVVVPLLSCSGPSSARGRGSSVVPIQQVRGTAVEVQGLAGVRSADQFVREVVRVVTELNEFWSRQERGYVAPGRLLLWAPPDPPPACGRFAGAARNGFYCRERRWVMADGLWLAAEARVHGPGFMRLVLAHEWGHAWQATAGVPVSRRGELQADCLAGMTLRRLAPAELRKVVDWLRHAAVGAPASATQARVDAIAAGADRGMGVCRTTYRPGL